MREDKWNSRGKVNTFNKAAYKRTEKITGGFVIH
jgi:hypothetical protein